MQAAISGAEEALVQQLGRSPRPREIAEHLEADLDLVLEALGATGCYVPSSLDAPLSPGESSELGQMLGADELGFESAEARAQLGPVLAGLTERERTIIELRFGQNRTQAEIGAAIGVTQMQVSRLLSATLAKLRTALEPAAA
ncbi:sigma-70 family RNA polymerase sigma factor [Nocardioides houyundeii]|nr:sigma-70 family RNA polymerase sigma factor [Nocardioides houyundeii]